MWTGPLCIFGKLFFSLWGNVAKCHISVHRKKSLSQKMDFVGFIKVLGLKNSLFRKFKDLNFLVNTKPTTVSTYYIIKKWNFVALFKFNKILGHFLIWLVLSYLKFF